MPQGAGLYNSFERLIQKIIASIEVSQREDNIL
jgi:hypothetical protein